MFLIRTPRTWGNGEAALSLKEVHFGCLVLICAVCGSAKCSWEGVVDGGENVMSRR